MLTTDLPSWRSVPFGEFGQVRSEPCIDKEFRACSFFNVTVCLCVCLSLASTGGEAPCPGHVTSCCCPIGRVA